MHLSPSQQLLRFGLLSLGVTALAAGAAGGLTRLGWTGGDAVQAAAAMHSPLMIGCFLGTLVSLERAVMLGRGWGNAALHGVLRGGEFGTARAWGAFLNVAALGTFAIVLAHGVRLARRTFRGPRPTSNPHLQN